MASPPAPERRRRRVVPYRVLLAITSSDIGGAEAIVRDLAVRLDRRQFDPQMCSLRPPGRMAEEVATAGVPVNSFYLSERPRSGELFRAVLAMAHLLRTQRIDVVHSFLYRANVVARLASRITRHRPVVITGHHSIEPYGGRLVTSLSRYSRRFSDRCVVPSRAVRDVLIRDEGVTPARIVVIPNGIDIARFRPGLDGRSRREFGIASGDVVVGAVGRFSAEKAFHLLLSAVAELRHEQVPIHLLLIGDGPERRRLEDETVRLAIEPFVHFLGMQTEVQPLYALTDIFVLPSLHEAAPMTLLEAMACGCAVIATRRGGAPEMVEHGQSGLLVEPGQVSALVEAIRSLARSDAERRRLAEAGLERVRAYFDVNRMVREHAHLYSTLGSARRRGLRGRRW